MAVNADVELNISKNCPWNKLPTHVKQSLGNSSREYDKAVFNFSVKNQLRYKVNLVRQVRKDERRYYEELLKYSQEHLMLYPFHLSDVIVKGLRVTPFAYYINIMSDIMSQEKSYDSLPNFTAADCLRLLGIGRNQYIDLMNQCRSSKKFFRKKPVRELLPGQPIDNIAIEPWWIVQAGYITEDDIKTCLTAEKKVIDRIIDSGGQLAGGLDYRVLHGGLYKKGLVYLDVPVEDDDCIIVPPLEGFVMNRVTGDYFETLLYKIFVSIDEHTSVAELANVLQIDLQLVKNAVSMYCRLGFAKKKGLDVDFDSLHPSWKNYDQQSTNHKKVTQDQLLIDWTSTINEFQTEEKILSSPDTASSDGTESSVLTSGGHSKRIAFLFDSTLTAFLMMGNLSPGLKSHAVTMFEVGKLSDESMDSFLTELEKVGTVAEGEAQRYFDHAITLRDTVRFLRHNKDMVTTDMSGGTTRLGIDLLRCESLLGLDAATCSRLLNKNYTLLVSMAPLSNEIQPVSSSTPQHMGPAIPEVNSMWFKFYLYNLTGNGPPSLLLVKGTKLKKLPKIFQEFDRLLITTWGHDPAVIATSNILLTLNDALQHSSVLVQGHGWHNNEGQTAFVPFPLVKDDDKENCLSQHTAVQLLAANLDLQHTCGYITLLCTGEPQTFQKTKSLPSVSPEYRNVSASHSPSPGPKNGIHDSDSAKVLASELDSLELNMQQSDHGKRGGLDRALLTLDVGENKETHHTEPVTGQTNTDTDWMLLDCSYGVPLFDAHVNQVVCDRISSQGLFSNNSLDALSHSSKKLADHLLDFISQFKLGESETVAMAKTRSNTSSSGSPTHQENTNQRNIPLPTQNLLFLNGTVRTWNTC